MKPFRLAILFLMIPLIAFAYTPDKAMRKGFSVGAEWIYFSPTSETTEFATQVPGPGFFNQAEQQTITPPRQPKLPTTTIETFDNRLDKYYSGYRVFGSYSFCCCDAFLAVTWTDLQVDRKSGATASNFDVFVLDTFSLVEAQNAEDKINFRYSAVDGVFGIGILSNCYLDFTIYGGVHYARLKSNEKTVATNPVEVGITRLNAKYWGVGPEMGLSMEGLVGCGFSLRGTATGAFIIGKSETAESNEEFTNRIIGSGEYLDIPDVWRVVPYGDLRVSGVYDFCFPCSACGLSRIFGCNFRGSIEAGYEALVYSGALIDFVNDFSFNNFRSVTMHGPFVSLAIHF